MSQAQRPVALKPAFKPKRDDRNRWTIGEAKAAQDRRKETEKMIEAQIEDEVDVEFQRERADPKNAHISDKDLLANVMLSHVKRVRAVLNNFQAQGRMSEISTISGIRTMLGLHSALKPNAEKLRSKSPSGEEWFGYDPDGNLKTRHIHQKPAIFRVADTASAVKSNYQQLTPEGAAAYMSQLEHDSPFAKFDQSLTPSTLGGRNQSSEFAIDGFLRNEAIQNAVKNQALR